MNEMFYECPKCKSTAIPAEQFDVEGGIAWRAIRCEDCGFEWQEVFEFSHNENRDADELDADGNVVGTIILEPVDK
jgi:DNA-directed RNA polymerase subunit RPC12/RpoP